MNIFRFALIYHLYHYTLVKLVRFIVFILLLAFCILSFTQGVFPHVPLFMLSVFLISEVTYKYKILKIEPNLTVSENTHDIYESFTLQAYDAFFFTQNLETAIKHLLKKRNVQFILHKANIKIDEIQIISLNKQDVGEKAFAIVKEIEGKFVTSMDLFIAYLRITEEKTKLLFNKHLKDEDIAYILYWARVDNPEEEAPPPARVHFWGEGIGESFTTGWTLETKKYTTDITYKVLNEKPVLLGRKQEFQSLVDILSRSQKNNALLIGEPGSGKTSLVDALALNSFLGRLGGRLYHKRVYQLLIGPLVAGTRAVGDLEERIEAILQELSHAGNIILFIPDLENIVGASSFHLDLSGALNMALKDSKLPVVATITPGSYKTYVEPLSTFADLFENIKIEEPGREEAVQMLLEKANEIEDKMHITITFKAVIAAVDLARRFMQDKALPGSAMSLLNAVVASASGQKGKIVDEADIIAHVEQQTKVAIAAPEEQEKGLLLHLEEKLHERVIGQDEAVNAIAQAIRRVRAGLATQTRPISFLFLGPTGVGKTETAKALAEIYFGGEDKTIRLDMSEYTSFGSIDRLLGATAGGGMEKGELTEKVYEHPFSLVLLDEFEKANTEVLDLFLQVLEDGRLTDNHGKRVSFANTIIIATSNGGALFIQDKLKQGIPLDATFQQGLFQQLEQEHIFKPELLNRFDGIVVFKPLNQEDTQKIARLFLKNVTKKLSEQDIHVSFDESLVAVVAKEGFDPEFGARPLRRFIQDKIEDPISRAMLEGSIVRGSQVTVSCDQNSNIVLSKE